MEPAFNILNSILPAIAVLVVFPLALLFYISVHIRRSHDFNNNGVLITVLSFIPIINLFVWVYLLLKEGDEKENDYGEPNNNSLWDNTWNFNGVFKGRIGRLHYFLIPYMVITPLALIFAIYGFLRAVTSFSSVNEGVYAPSATIVQ